MSFMGSINAADSQLLVPGASSARSSCDGCRNGSSLGFDFTMAFQPIVDIATGRVWAYEALVRGLNGEGASTILGQVRGDAVYGFDQACRVKAVELAGRLFPADEETRLSINFMPNAVYEPNACIRATLAAARIKRVRLRELIGLVTPFYVIVGCPSPCTAQAQTTYASFSGSARRRIPTASKTALPMAGAMPTMAVSPAPALGRSLRSRSTTSISGTSRKRGTR